MNLFERLSLRLARHRQPQPQPGWLSLNHRQLYIWLTPAGGLFLCVLAAILLGGVNYQSNLAYLLCFLLGCMLLISMFHSYRNLLGIRLTLGHIQPVFAGEPLVLPLILHSARAAYALQVDDQEQLQDLKPADPGIIKLVRPTSQRGYYQLDRLKLHSLFPLGLMRVWSWQCPQSQALVYPKPEDPDYLPQALFGLDDDDAANQFAAGGDPDSLRPYRTGDSLQRIHWRSLARSGQLVTREGEQPQGDPWLLSLANLSHEPLERALSILCFWLLQAEQQQRPYGLQLDSLRIAPSQGAEHLQHCLTQLALYQPGQG